MSGFAVIYERSNTPVDPAMLERVMARLDQRGPDGRDVFLAGPIAMGHWHFWTTPEEVGERQPLELAGLPFKIVLDGRLDNRAELLAELALQPVQGKPLSDSALVLYAYERWGEHCLEHFIGEFALAILDQHRGELLCGRDALGDRSLFYAFQGTCLVVASEAWAVAGAGSSAPQLNESTVADYFALKTPPDGQTFFKSVYELLPAQALLVSASGQRTWRYWQPDPSARLRGQPDEAYAEQFRTLLEQSVRCRLRAVTPVGVLMSGGLDSTSVACLAARLLSPRPLTTLSYVFDELADCNERPFIEAVQQQYGLHSIQIPCDDAWPYQDWEHWPHNPNQPEQIPYRLLRERAYRQAHMEGLRVLLTGGFGDHLYAAGLDWLGDLIAEGRYLEAGRELSLYFRYSGIRWTLRAGFIQRAARHLGGALPAGLRLPAGRSAAPAWMTPYSAGLLSPAERLPDPALERVANLVGVEAASSCSGEVSYTNRHALELRHPYRDRRLVEFVLSLPAYQLYYHGLSKHILRIAMRGILPELIRTRLQPTSMEALYLRGVEREKTILQACLEDPGSAWRKFVRADLLLDHMRGLVIPAARGSESVIPWLCVSYEAWYKRKTKNMAIIN
ncbi:MAG: asparagine synthase-related protein [Anaerolineales bacterium]